MRNAGISGSVVGQMPRMKNVMFGSQSIRLYSIGWLCLATQNAAVTLRLWERKGILPPPFFKLSGPRWYSALEIKTYADIIRRHYQADRNLKKLRVDLHSAQVTVRRAYAQAKSTGVFHTSLCVFEGETNILSAINKAVTLKE